MANHLYSTSYSAGAYAARSSAGSAAVDPYLPSDPSLRGYSTSTNYLSSYQSDPTSLRYSSATAADYSGGYSAAAKATAEAPHLASWSAATVDASSAGIKRPSESLYHQTHLGAYNTIGQSDDWYSTNPLVKRPRFETASNLSIYPQRPGEKDCAYYMRTRTCMFGDSCKFDHPLWVPEGGIPDWKEVPLDATAESFPERPGEPDCPYFMKTQKCKYGVRCKFNHPKDKVVTLDAHGNAGSNLPDRPSEPPCAFYLKTGICKFGTTCKFHHPKDIQVQPAEQVNSSAGQNATAAIPDGTIGQMNTANLPITPALFHNTKGLPIRLGEVDCPFYLKTGSCKYGATCRYNHPERYAINVPGAVGHTLIPSSAAHLNIGAVNPAAAMLQAYDPRFTQTAFGLTPTIYPQRPGQTECDYYMKSGECKFGERCKFHHPIDRSASTQSAKDAQNVKLTLAGLPRREGSLHCPYYMKTGACKYGANCKFDHPPPGEVLATVTSTADAEEGKEDEQEP